MDLELRHLRIVVTVADSGSITRVAARLGVSQPAMSAQVKRIEQAFGGRLFDRGQAGVAPTALGESVVERCRAIVHEVDALLAVGRAHDGGEVALVLGANSSGRFTALLDHLAAMGVEHDLMPRVDVSSTVLQAMLVDGVVDLALLGVHPGYDAECPSGLQELVVVDVEPFLLALAADHPLAGHREIDVRDLGRERWLLPPGRPDGTDAALRACWTAAGIEPATPYGRQDIETFWHYISTRRAVAVTLPESDPPPGAVLRPLRGIPIYGREVLRWNPHRVSHEQARLYARAAAAAFTERIAVTAHHQAWWAESPEHRPTFGPGIS